MKPIIIGDGLAGLTVALSLAPTPVILLSPKKLSELSASSWAQGGIAAALAPDDTPEFHAQDTVTAGAGLCDPKVVKAITDDGPNVIEFLESKGVKFERSTEGQYQLGLEGAHGQRRIAHTTDTTGASIIEAMARATRATPSIEVLEETSAIELLSNDGKIYGVVIERHEAIFGLPANQVVLATGGVGALWKETSNPLGSWGGGLYLAARAGAELGDLEFVQFHPTAIDIGRDPMPLASEALRGEGCTLINENGERFVDELLPRDVVARAMWAERAKGKKVFLDARTALGGNFSAKFPAIHALCIAAGIDPVHAPIPVSPAAHYHMGGVLTDLHGRTNIEGLWACGEVACTGLHGANRLASNSLLEAVSMGQRVAKDIRQNPSQHFVPEFNYIADKPTNDESLNNTVRTIMSKYVGLLRNKAGLETACTELAGMADHSNRALVGLMIAYSALMREESRGSHARTDFPESKTKWQHHQCTTLDDIKHYLHPTQHKQANGA